MGLIFHNAFLSLPGIGVGTRTKHFKHACLWILMLTFEKTVAQWSCWFFEKHFRFALSPDKSATKHQRRIQSACKHTRLVGISVSWDAPAPSIHYAKWTPAPLHTPHYQGQFFSLSPKVKHDSDWLRVSERVLVNKFVPQPIFALANSPGQWKTNKFIFVFTLND